MLAYFSVQLPRQVHRKSDSSPIGEVSLYKDFFRCLGVHQRPENKFREAAPEVADLLLVLSPGTSLTSYQDRQGSCLFFSIFLEFSLN